MRTLLIIGSLPENKIKETLYNEIKIFFNLNFEVIFTPIDTKNFKGNDKERYKLAFEKVKIADLIIAETSDLSIGLGMEIRESVILNKKLIVIAKKGTKVSGLIKGSPNLKELIFYENILDLIEKLKNSLGKKY
ncbi:MAG: hypothetical protein PHE25_06200 [Candidatus Gracilibacteria bacterium]|nr:hypothetical protein [Candidatus Gracilibacteria bacterium]